MERCDVKKILYSMQKYGGHAGFHPLFNIKVRKDDTARTFVNL